MIHAIDMNDLEYFMDCFTAMYSVANTINKLNIMPDFHSGYIYNFYNGKHESIDDLFCQ